MVQMRGKHISELNEMGLTCESALTNMDMHVYAQLSVCVCGCVSVFLCLRAHVRVRARVCTRAYVRAAPAAPQRRLRRRDFAFAAPAAPHFSTIFF